MARLFQTELPTNLKELQSLLGRLNFASIFVGDYKRLIEPITRLMSSSSDHLWTTEQSGALNELAQAVWSCLKLTVCNMALPAELHVDVDEEYGSVILVQHTKSGVSVIAMGGYKLAATERSLLQMERLLVVALQGLKRY